MAKKKSAVAPESSRDKARLELRFDAATYDRLQALTGALHVSTNRFLEALTQWALDNAVQGYPVIHPDGRVYVQDRPGAVFFGVAANDVTNEPGRVDFAIEFNPRWAIRKPYDPRNPEIGLG